MKVAITGATGFVGSRLVERLYASGHQVLILTRNPATAQKVFPNSTLLESSDRRKPPSYKVPSGGFLRSDFAPLSLSAFPNLEIIAYTPTESGSWQQAIAGCEAVVNLAGAPIAEERWTPERKQKILDSRKLGTQKIVEAIAQANPKPSVLVNASAIGYYGTSETATFDETSAAGNDFLAQVCQAWEAEAQKVQDTGTRLVILRLGIVLGMGGAIAKMITPFKLFAGGPIGSGRQWFSWIHRDDLVNLILQALTRPDMEGIFNATTPNPVRMEELSQTMGQVLNRPSWLPVPSFALEVLLGDGAMVVLEGQQVLPKRTKASGFEYQYPTVKQALSEIL